MEDRYNAFDATTHTVFFPKVYENFPYPERYCKFCEQQMEIVNAIHHSDYPEVYKCVMLCQNKNCGAFDEEAKKAYMRVYYSCEEARILYEPVLLRYRRLEVD